MRVYENVFPKMMLFFGDIVINVLIGIVSLFLIGVIYAKWSFNYWKRKEVHSLPVTFPFGNTKEFILRKTSMGADIKKVYDECKSKSLRYGGMYFFLRPIFVPIDPELIKAIMSNDFNHFVDHGNYVNEEVDPLSGHLFSLKGLKWKNLRAKLTPTFTSGKMKMMFQTLVDCSNELINVMDKASINNESVDIKDVVGRFTTDVIGSCAFGIDCNCLKNPNSEFREYGKKGIEIDNAQSIKHFIAICYPQLLDFFKIPITRKDVATFFMNIVNETVKYREENNISRKDFMHLLIQLKNNVKLSDENFDQLKDNLVSDDIGKTLTMPELAAQAFVFFLAGFETSSTTLTFCFYELVKNMKVQDKLREEVVSVLRKHDGRLTYDAIMEMTYMDKCINETLRKYPPLPILIRECNKTYKIPNSGLTIEPGTTVFISTLGLQNDPEHYPNPERFDPERFSPENKATRHTFTWLPFGEGPRACIGIRFGMMQTKVALAILLKNYKFTLNSKTEQPLVIDPKSFIMSARKRVWLNTIKISA